MSTPLSQEELIKKYCETLENKYIQQLSQVNKVMFKRFSQIALKYENTNHNVAQRVVALTDRKINQKPSRDKAGHTVRKMTVSSTGARKDDVLIGSHKGTKNAIIKVLNDVPPSQGTLDRVRPYPDLWKKFIFKLGSIKFFSEMDPLGREIWLEMYENTNDYFDSSDRLKLLQPGTGDPIRKDGSIFVAYLPTDVIDEMMSREYVLPEQVNQTIIYYTGKSSTLCILKSFWQISMSYGIGNQFDGLTIDLQRGDMKG